MSYAKKQGTGRCEFCKYSEKIQSDFNPEGELRCNSRHSGIYVISHNIGKHTHSCFEPRKQEEKKTTWFLYKILSDLSGTISDVLVKHEMLNGGGQIILSTKQIDTAETNIKIIWGLLNEATN